MRFYKSRRYELTYRGDLVHLRGGNEGSSRSFKAHEVSIGIFDARKAQQVVHMDSYYGVSDSEFFWVPASKNAIY